MPVNSTDSICPGCFTAPGSRHMASCSQTSQHEVYEGSTRKLKEQFIRDPARVEENPQKQYNPSAADPQQRTVAALESIAMSLDAIAKHLLNPVADPAKLGTLTGPLTPGRAVRLTPEGSAPTHTGQEPPEERS